MGEIVAAALVSHVPPIMYPVEWRTLLGEDTDLIDGLRRVRSELDRVEPDTFVIVDTHWFTTIEHVLAGAAHHRGVFTSEEVPTVLSGIEYDYPGAPVLGAMCEQVARERYQERGFSDRPRVVSVDDPHLPHHYSTLNVVEHLRRDEKVLSTGVNQTAQLHNYLEYGDLIREAVSRVDCRVAVLASGGMSHRFHPYDMIVTSPSLKYDADCVHSHEAYAYDMRVLDLWSRGDHAGVVDSYDEYMRFFPEAWFGHYLIMLGALGGSQFSGKGRPMSRYENMLGTGAVHVWFDVLESAT